MILVRVELFANEIIFYIKLVSEEGSYLSSNRNSPKSERIENAPLSILISNTNYVT